MPRQQPAPSNLPTGPDPYRIAVVGAGPRGLAVAERLVARARTEPLARRTEILLLDAVEVGSGRVWRTGQPAWFLMNTAAGEISAFSGPPDDGPDRPGAGPSFAQWWARTDPEELRDGGDYAPRRRYGGYLRYALDRIVAALPEELVLRCVVAEVVDLDPSTDRPVLHLADGTTVACDRVVLSTGHPLPDLDPDQQRLASFATSRPHLRYLRGDSAADMPLDAVPAGCDVGILGMGLTFYDVMAALTTGRGGRYVPVDDPRGGTELRYEPSWREPSLVAGSRSGMPQPARGRNQKPGDHVHAPVFFTPGAIRGRTGPGPLDFRRDLLPWLMAEVHLVQYTTALRLAGRQDECAEFVRQVLAAPGGSPDVAAVAARFDVPDQEPIAFDVLAAPFHGRRFADPAAFAAALDEALRADLSAAERGNVDDPVKAALDVLRSLRWVIRELADFGGLTAASHRDDLIGWYSSRSSFLAAGPPLVRLQQVRALLEAGVLRVVGPGAVFGTDPDADGGRFTVHSEHVAGSRRTLDVVVDARIPVPALDRDRTRLTRSLRDRGVWSAFVNDSGVDDPADAFRTGGVAVTRSPFHPLGRDGTADPRLYVIGIPSEHTRWFMQVVASGPRTWSDFARDADAIAADALRPVAPAPAPTDGPAPAPAAAGEPVPVPAG